MSAVQKIEDAPVTVPMTPMEMVGRALEMGVSADILKQMMDLRDREEARNAKLAFTRAVAAAKSEIKPIIKTREVDYQPQGKARVHYRHEDLAGIDEQISPILTRYGLSYRFESENGPEKPITVTCVLEHADGHSTRTPLSAGADSSGGKNSLQAIASAVTYLQRYTLKLALGLSVSHDDDGRASGDGAPSREETFPGDLPTVRPKSSAQLKRDGAWQAIESDFWSDMNDVQSLYDLGKLREQYRDRARKERWTRAWGEALANLFDTQEDRLSAEDDAATNALGAG